MSGVTYDRVRAINGVSSFGVHINLGASFYLGIIAVILTVIAAMALYRANKTPMVRPGEVTTSKGIDVVARYEFQVVQLEDQLGALGPSNLTSHQFELPLNCNGFPDRRHAGTLST